MSQLTQLQQSIKALAMQLANLNVQQNEILTRTETTSEQIAQLRQKVQKKKKQIEQEHKDKMLIEEKLIQAERKRDQLQRKKVGSGHKVDVEKKQQTTKTKTMVEQPKKAEKIQEITIRKPAVVEDDPYGGYGTGHGDYQPPLLFSTNSKEEDKIEDKVEESEEDILARIRQSVADDDD